MTITWGLDFTGPIAKLNLIYGSAAHRKRNLSDGDMAAAGSTETILATAIDGAATQGFYNSGHLSDQPTPA